MIKILVVDDSSFNRTSLINMIKTAEGAEDIEIIGDVGSGSEAIEFCQTNSPDLILMDYRMPPGMTGIEAAKKIKTLNQQIKILMISDFYEHEANTGLQENYFDGYLNRSCIASSKDLINTINSALQNISVFSPDVIKKLFDKKYSFEPIPEELFSKEEIRILELVAQGLTSQIIADQVGYSYGTLRNKMQRICKIAKVKNKNQLIRWCLDRGL